MLKGGWKGTGWGDEKGDMFVPPSLSVNDLVSLSF